jgi:ribosomal protein S18 acetylase RimI-like enzyme
MSAAIRPARASDVDGLVAMEEAVFASDRLSRRSFRHLLASPAAALLVSEARGGLDGYAILLFRQGSGSARLYSIAVAPGRAGAGIGRALLDAALTAAAERGCGELRLEVREDNARAIALYERSGFTPGGRLPDYYADGEAALRYVRPVAGRDRGTRPEARDPETRKRTPS